MSTEELVAELRRLDRAWAHAKAGEPSRKALNAFAHFAAENLDVIVSKLERTK